MLKEISDPHDVHAAAHLFDDPPTSAATERFLNSDDHHLLIAYDGDLPVGMITGVEMTHPDKGTEMFVYELGVDATYEGRGIGTQLVQALADLARRRGCYGMWVATEPDNAGARRTYRKGGATEEEQSVTLSWTF